MSTAEHYDVVVVGRSLAALLAAALLARRKLRVRALPCPSDGLDEVGEPLFGLRTAPIVQRVLEELGLVHAVRTKVDGGLDPVAVALPDRRFTLEPELTARGRELGRAFPEARAGLLGLFGRIEGYGGGLDALLGGDLELPAEGIAARIALRRAFAGVPAHQLGAHPIPWAEDESLRALVSALLAVAGRADEARGSMNAAGARALWHLAHGVDRIRGGRAGLAELVEEKLRAHGGDAELRRPVVGFEVKRRRITALLAAGERRYTAEVVVFAGDDTTLNRLVGEPLVRAPVVSAQVARAAVPPELRPGGLRDPCAWLPSPGAPPCLVRPENGDLWLTWSGAPPCLETLVPFTDARLLDIAPRVLPGPGSVDPLGLFRVPVRGPLRNLVRTGAWVVRGLGLEGDFLTAWHAAQVAARLAPRRRFR